MAKLFLVYLHTAPNGKAYVGWTGATAGRRWQGHCASARRGGKSIFHRAVRKYGAAAFTHVVLDVLHTEAAAKQAEVLWIRELGTRCPRGYNQLPGGDGRAQASDATRAKMSVAHAARWASYSPDKQAEIAAKSAASRRGVKRTPEQCARIGAAHKGLQRTPAQLQRAAEAQRARRTQECPDRAAEWRLQCVAAISKGALGTARKVRMRMRQWCRLNALAVPGWAQ